ncbi:hypothetical protein BJ122_102227 [Rhodopseudomonas faecalis]|uniref:Uncharacterized protein n=1 Tax=Rhodopseudomonas faecalis TaxID=99655 RepID=A0A318TJF1_9BRAD|nr:hypothetical protein [Rhodopseudomonas faecalis]PYF05001.1 hypothetical protein BJ122_102227 [Rhodopseudomonas faecalis]
MSISERICDAVCGTFAIAVWLIAYAVICPADAAASELSGSEVVALIMVAYAIVGAIAALIAIAAAVAAILRRSRRENGAR